jgi:hypothetical protein
MGMRVSSARPRTIPRPTEGVHRFEGSMGYRHSEAKNGILMARAPAAGGDAAGAESALACASELATALAARDLLPSAEEARAELAPLRGDDAACEQALCAAARMHRENGEEWLATQAEGRIGA